MNIAKFSIQRPIFISSIVILMLITGWVSLNRLGVDLFPDVNIPVVTVQTIYRGAGPEEVENLISKPLEEELSSISGLKRLSSRNQESLSVVVAEFTLSTDIKYAEQQVRDKTARVRRNLPDGIEEPLVVRFDPADQSIVKFALSADLPEAELYDLAKEKIKPQLERIPNVGSIKISGGVRREIQIELDREKLNSYKVPAVVISNQLKNAGSNIPVGKNSLGSTETNYRTIGEFDNLKQIENAVVSFSGDYGNGVTIGELGKVIDGTEEQTTMGYLYAPVEERKPIPFIYSFLGIKRERQVLKREKIQCIFLDVYKQSGSNTVQVANDVIDKVNYINEELQKNGKESSKNNPKMATGIPKLVLVYDSSKWIRFNIEDVSIAIILGIILAVVVVYLFLGNIRSTIITGLALPNSLLGAFILMLAMGFSINVMSLLALSLTVGLLVDDAIVVRENIFRKLEEGIPVPEAAERGTTEVMLAVIATTATIIAVFLPIGFLQGIVGQFFKQFGLTVVFAMLISSFDALTVAPMLSAYFAGNLHKKPNFVIRLFERFQNFLDRIYEYVMRFCLRYPWAVLLTVSFMFFASLATLAIVKKTFMPPNDQGEFMVYLELPPGTSLDGTYQTVLKVEEKLKTLKELDYMTTLVGTQEGESNIAIVSIGLVPAVERNLSTAEIKDNIRKMLKEFQYAKPKVNDYSMVGGGVQYPFYLLLMGDDLEVLDKYSKEVMAKLANINDLTDIGTTYQGGKPEFQIKLEPEKMQEVGVTPGVAGAELRYHIAGGVVGKLHNRGIEYDIRMRLKPEQRDLKTAYNTTFVPNMAFRMIPLSAISHTVNDYGPARIFRQDRSRVIQVYANLAPDGAIASATEKAKIILNKEITKPPGVNYTFVGQSEDFRELIENIILAFGLALVFIYLVLASLYESFITPLTILFAIPPAISGAFFSLALTGEMLNIFSMIGIILLMGLVTKNSILLVDHAMEGVKAGLSRSDAIFKAGQTRLRPILMTSLAMIAGTLPIALGLGEAAKSRTAMGIAIIGGLFVSTLVTLIVVPAVYGYIDTFREFIESKFRPEAPISSPPD